MIKAFKLRWFYILSLLYIAVNSILIGFDLYYLFLSPVVLALGALLVLSIDKFMLFSALLVPFSVDLKESDLGFAVSVPSEPIIIMLMIGFLFKAFIEQSVDGRILKHPVTIMIGLYLMWIAITSVTSEIPMVSFKFLASRLWFIIPFYFLGVQVFRKFRTINDFQWMYIIAFVGVIIYTITRHAYWGFEKDPAHWVMTPFYYDHTQYGAMLAFFIPFLTTFAWRNRLPLFMKILAGSVLGLFITALILSSSRAAWLSVVIALVVYLLVKLRVKWYVFVAGLLCLVGAYFYFQTEIMMRLEKNKQDSSANISEHIQSMSNISSDASNLERLLRWNCAIRMFNERPLLGWGPGTYTFTYAPFQRSYELTIISTNFGDGGNAHSEYLGPLAEEGILGLLLFVGLLVAVSITALNTYKRLNNRFARRSLIGIYLGLVTYWAHGLMNNFLDSDKAAVPFWGSIAAIVAISLYHKPSVKAAG